MDGDLETLFSRFDTVTLSDLHGVKLLERTDVKYLTHPGKFIDLVPRLKNHYHALKIDDVILQSYETEYYDTPECLCYHQHQNQRLERYKVRIRKYIDSNLLFYEVKHKNHKGYTTKLRKRLDPAETKRESGLIDFANRAMEQKRMNWEKKLTIRYKRITLTDKNFTERVTIDTDLCFEGQGLRNTALSQAVIIEVKKGHHNQYSPITQILRDGRIFRIGFSKYCLGMALIYKNLKRNRMKEELRIIEKRLARP